MTIANSSSKPIPFKNVKHAFIMKKLINLSSFSLIFTLFLSYCFAQQGITYQAVIYQDQAPLASTEFDMIFSFHIGNENLYQENHIGSTNAQGLVSVVLGEFNPESFEAVDWSRPGIQLRVELETQDGGFYETISDQTLQSVPYSQLADRVKELPPIPLESLSNVDSFNPERGEVLAWNGRQWTGSRPTLTPSSTWDQQTGTQDITYEKGNVGIGTDEPRSLLTLGSERSANEDEGAQLQVKNIGSGGAYMNFHVQGAASYAMGIENAEGLWKLGFDSDEADMESRTLLSVTPEGQVEIPEGVTIGDQLRVFKEVIAEDDLSVRKNAVVDQELEVKGRLTVGERIDIGGPINGSTGIFDQVFVVNEVNRNGSGLANMLPVAYGSVNSSGQILHGSDNFLVDNSTFGQKVITLGNTYPEDGNYSMVATPDHITKLGIPSPSLCTVELTTEAGKPTEFTVHTWDMLPSPLITSNGFSFVIYRK